MHKTFKINVHNFNYDLDFETTDFRKNPELYRVGKGEQGVLLVEPYKSEILPFWRFKTEEIAQASAEKIYGLFKNYLQANDFVGADMARKYLQMGYTRARRYANYKGGKKYKDGNTDQTEGLPYPYSSGSSNKGNETFARQADAYTSEKAKAAQIFKKYWDTAKNHPDYLNLKQKFIEKFSQS
ncbi:MAG: DUF4385 domain-containing protein [Verrucomicrobia bacterium]|nr:DUF4385 domain-containing protein [Cytophagales bacterium]